MANKRIFALIYRLTFALVALLGIIFNTKMFTSVYSPTTLLYYTCQSNILALGLFIYLSVKTALDLKNKGKIGSNSYAPNITFMLMIDILLTFVVFWALLAPEMIHTSYNLWSFSNLAVHTLVPLAVLGDYLLFNNAKKLKYRHVYMALIFPTIYAINAILIGAFQLVNYYTFDILDTPSHFPYFFFDFVTNGWMILVYILGIAGFILILSNISYFLLKRHERIRLNKAKISD